MSWCPRGQVQFLPSPPAAAWSWCRSAVLPVSRQLLYSSTHAHLELDKSRHQVSICPMLFAIGEHEAFARLLQAKLLLPCMPAHASVPIYCTPDLRHSDITHACSPKPFLHAGAMRPRPIVNSPAAAARAARAFDSSLKSAAGPTRAVHPLAQVPDHEDQISASASTPVLALEASPDSCASGIASLGDAWMHVLSALYCRSAVTDDTSAA